MPSGYTCDVADGKVTDFRTFALRCARAFGACIEQRDNPSDEPPKPRTPSSYYAEREVEHRKRLAELQGMTAEAIEAEAARVHDKHEAMMRQWAEERRAKRERYEAMLVKARKWVAPTPEHDGLRKFMIDQLQESIQFDCGGKDEQPTPRPTAQEWYAEALRRETQEIAYCEKHRREDEERVRGANAWIEALYRSLDAPMPAASEVR